MENDRSNTKSNTAQGTSISTNPNSRYQGPKMFDNTTDETSEYIGGSGITFASMPTTDDQVLKEGIIYVRIVERSDNTKTSEFKTPYVECVMTDSKGKLEKDDILLSEVLPKYSQESDESLPQVTDILSNDTAKDVLRGLMVFDKVGDKPEDKVQQNNVLKTSK